MTVRNRIRPSFWPTAFAVPAVLTLIALGTWQVERLHWKEGLIADLAARDAAAAVPVPFAGTDLASVEYRHAVVTGTFLHDREMLLAARTHDGSVGAHVVTPLTMADGGMVLVDRGWVPEERKRPATRAAGQLTGTVTIDGIIRVPRRAGWFEPDNDPGRSIWFRVDPPAMAAQIGLAGTLAPVYLEAGSAPNPGGLPIGGQTRIDLPNDHLQYAIIWYSLAGALIVIYVLYHRQLKRRAGDPRSDIKAS